jgi:hypothetical protein
VKRSTKGPKAQIISRVLPAKSGLGSPDPETGLAAWIASESWQSGAAGWEPRKNVNNPAKQTV